MRETQAARPARKAPHFLIVLNRRAARTRLDRLDQVLTRLAAAGATHELVETAAAGDAARFMAGARDVTAVVIAGGDGTVNDAIQGFAPDGPPLGLIPLGTANVLAHELGIGTDPATIAQTLLAGEALTIRPGLVGGRRFVMMASAGFDAHVVRNVRRSLKQRIGKLVYVWVALQQLRRYPCPPLQVSLDDAPVVAATVVVSRGRFYGGRFVLTPDADLAVPEFHVALFPRAGRLAAALYCAALPLGLLTRWGLIRHMRAQKVNIAGRPGDPLQVDGDAVASLPAVIELAPQPIRVLRPPRQSRPTTKIT